VRLGSFVHACAKLTVAGAAVFVAVRPAAVAAQPHVVPEAASTHVPNPADEVRLVIDPNVEFSTALNRLLSARLQSAGLKVTYNDGQELETHPAQTDVGTQSHALMLLLRAHSTVFMGVLVRVEGDLCRVALINTSEASIAVRDLPLTKGNYGPIVEEVANVVLSSANAQREQTGAPAIGETPAAKPASAPPKAGHNRLTPSATEESLRLVVRAGLHIQSLNTSTFSLGPRVHLGVKFSERSKWLVTAAGTYHLRQTVHTEHGDFDVAHATLSVGPAYEWQFSPTYYGGLGVSGVLGHVARGAARAVNGAEGAAKSNTWRPGAELMLLAEARPSALRIGVSLAGGMWSTAIDFASSEGDTLMTEEAIFAAAAVWLGYEFGN
jgi:hypothetical protein